MSLTGGAIYLSDKGCETTHQILLGPNQVTPFLPVHWHKVQISSPHCVFDPKRQTKIYLVQVLQGHACAQVQVIGPIRSNTIGVSSSREKKN